MRAAVVAVAASVLLRGTDRTALLPEGERECELPGHLNASIANEGWSFLTYSKSGRKAVVLAREPDNSDELGLLVYDCQTQRQLLFLHIPKNAGTTIEDVASGQGIAWGRNTLWGQQKMPDGEMC